MANTPKYEDFAINVEDDGQGGFRARILDSPYGRGTAAACHLPYGPDELTRLLEGLEDNLRSADVRRDLATAESRTITSGPTPDAVGARLFETLFQGEVRNRLRSSLDRVAEHPETGLRIRIVLDPSQPRLAPWTAIPWELLYRSDTQDFLSRSLRTPVVRHLDVPRPSGALPPVPLLRILVVAPRPRGLQSLQERQEITNLTAAWAKEECIEIRQLERATVRDLRRALRKEPIHALHFIGHGDFDPDTGEGALFFENERGDARQVSGSVLAETLKTTSRVRLAVLNACESAQLPRRGGQNPFGGVASALVMAGVPAVVAHQFRISDRAAVTFSDAFYHSLAQRDPVDSAVGEGRFAIYDAQPKAWEWITPVLYMGTPDGSILERKVPAPPEFPPQEEARDPLAEVREYIELGCYAEAISALEDALREQPRNSEIFYYLALAQIAGRRPRALTFDVMKRIESDLEKAKKLGEAPAQVFYLWALAKIDHYPWNGRTMTSPTADELVTEGHRRAADRGALELLLEQVPTPDNAVRQGIGARLAAMD